PASSLTARRSTPRSFSTRSVAGSTAWVRRPGRSLRLTLVVVLAQKERVQTGWCGGECVDPRLVQQPDNLVQMLGIDGEVTVEAVSDALEGQLGDAGVLGGALGRPAGEGMHGRAGVSAQLRHRPGAGDAPLADDAHPVGELLDLAED